MKRALQMAVTTAALLVAGGCRNPFDPSADIELARIYVQFSGATSIAIYQSQDLQNLTQLTSAWRWTVNCHLVYKNKVSAYIDSVNITYTDSAGNAVTSYKSIGGRSFRVTFRIEGVRDNTSTDESEGGATTLSLNVVDRRVIDELISPSYPSDKVMFANIVLRGEDANGYDLRLEGRIAIFLYP